jgi:hypothetical protein
MGNVRYRVRNWRDYNKALKDRYRITLWIREENAAAWQAQATGKRGAPPRYSDAAIQCCLTVRVLLRLPLRGCEGFMRSAVSLLGLPERVVPDYSTLSRRGKHLAVSLPASGKTGIHLVVDSSGLKIYGEGEWKVRTHGWSRRRTWRKLHLGVDTESQGIIVGAVTTADVTDGEVLPDLLEGLRAAVATVIADKAYDRRKDYEAIAGIGARAVIPPRENARIWRHGNRAGEPHIRDEHLRRIREIGRKGWKQESGYTRRSLAETAFSRLKRTFGGRLRSRSFENQTTEAFLMLRTMNILTALGMPDSVAVA